MSNPQTVGINFPVADKDSIQELRATIIAILGMDRDEATICKALDTLMMGVRSGANTVTGCYVTMENPPAVSKE